MLQAAPVVMRSRSAVSRLSPCSGLTISSLGYLYKLLTSQQFPLRCLGSLWQQLLISSSAEWNADNPVLALNMFFYNLLYLFNLGGVGKLDFVLMLWELSNL